MLQIIIEEQSEAAQKKAIKDCVLRSEIKMIIAVKALKCSTLFCVRLPLKRGQIGLSILAHVLY